MGSIDGNRKIVFYCYRVIFIDYICYSDYSFVDGLMIQMILVSEVLVIV